MNPYEILNLAPEATSREIKAAHKRLAKKWDPTNLAGPAKEEAEAHLRDLDQAMDVLKTQGAVRPDRKRSAPHSIPPSADAAPVATVEEPAMLPTEESPLPEESPVVLPDPIPAPTLPDPEVPAADKTAQAWFLEAKASMAAGAAKLGLSQIEAALGLDEAQGPFHALHALLLARTGAPERDQVKALEAAIRHDAGDVESPIALARVYEAHGLPARANRYWAMARGLAPGHPVFLDQPALGRADTATSEAGRHGLGDKVSAFLGRIFGKA
jgi:hypothetical protein